MNLSTRLHRLERHLGERDAALCSCTIDVVEGEETPPPTGRCPWCQRPRLLVRIVHDTSGKPWSARRPGLPLELGDTR